jgi:hypothetical protein
MTAVPTRAEMLAALADPNQANPLAARIGAAITGYGDLLNEQARRAGAVPNPFVVVMPRTAVDVFALEAFTRELAASGIQVSITVASNTRL